jgi:DNA polymerase-3 subunit gamma/tau
VDHGKVLDITEADAASNNGVESIRAIRDEVFFVPAVCKYRVYIIDEVHMLSTGAFNALLKILEEPPGHAVFILATTEVHKIPATVISRCQRFDFYRVSPENIFKRLDFICKKEKIEIEPKALEVICNVADGAVRDALSILDRCVSQSSGVLTLEHIKASLGITDKEHVTELLKCIDLNDRAGALILIDDLYKKSVNFSGVYEKLFEYFRKLLWQRILEDGTEPDCGYNGKNLLKNVSLEKIFKIAEILKDVFKGLTNSFSKQSELEIAVIKIGTVLCSDDGYSDNGVIENKPSENFDNKRKAAIPSAAETAPLIKTSPAKSAPELRPKKDLELKKFEQWPQILDLFKKKLSYKSMLKAFQGSFAYVKGNLLLIESKNDLVFEFLRDSVHREEMRSLIEEATGERYKLGPYRDDNIKSTIDKLDEFCMDAAKSNISMVIKNGEVEK